MRLKQHWLVFAAYLGLACVVTFPLVLNLGSQVIGGTVGDNYEMTRNIWWYAHALRTGQPLYYQTLLGYPEGMSSIVLAANQLQYFPAWALALVLPPALVFNLMALIYMALNGWALFFLAHDRLSRHFSPQVALMGASMAGAAFCIAPTLQAHLIEGHGGLLAQFAAPLYLWALWRMVEAQGQAWRRYALWSMLFFFLTPSGHMLQVFYMLMPILLALIVALAWRQDKQALQRVLLVSALSGALQLVFLLPMIADTLATPAYSGVESAVRYASDLLSLVTPSFLHPLWGQLSYPARVLGVNLAEGYAYVGVLGGALALWGAWHWRAARWWLGLLVLAWVLSLGAVLKLFDAPIRLNLGEVETHLTLPWALVQELPGFSLARTPGRFNFAIALALALLIGYGVADLARRAPHLRPLWRWSLLGALLLGMGVDYQASFPLPSRPSASPPIFAELRQADIDGALFDVPHENLLAAKDALYYQIDHQLPLIAGQFTRVTPVNPAKLRLLEATLDPALLSNAGARLVLFHRQRALAQDRAYAEALEARLRQNLGEPRYADAQIALYDVPLVLTEPAFASQALPEHVSERYLADFYAPQAGWADFSARLSAQDRQVSLWINGSRFQTFTVNGEQDLQFAIPYGDAGFQRVELRLEPACPQGYNPTLTCKTLSVSQPQVRPISRNYVREFIEYEGVLLRSVDVQRQGEMLELRLWWQFSQALSPEDIRFVHLLDNAGRIVQQDDLALGRLDAQQAIVETVRLPLRDLAEGRYSLRVGWYRYPDFVRRPVLTPNLIGGTDNAPEIDLISLP